MTGLRSRLVRLALCVVQAAACATAQAQAPHEASLRAAAAGMAASMERANLASATVLDLTDLQGRPTELGRFLAQDVSLEPFVFDSKQGLRYPLLMPASVRHIP